MYLETYRVTVERGSVTETVDVQAVLPLQALRLAENHMRFQRGEEWKAVSWDKPLEAAKEPV